MSSTQHGPERPRAPDEPPTIEAPRPLPTDLLREIAARADVATVLRCAAASKPLRRAILGRGFRHQLGLRAAANGGFGPALFLGFSYRIIGIPITHHVLEIASSRSQPRLRIDPGLLESLGLPVASRDGLLVFCRPGAGGDCTGTDELSVCDTLTGAVTSLPPTDVSADYPPALLTVGGGHDRPFELLVVDSSLRMQIFSSKNGLWGPVRAVHHPGQPPPSPSRASDPAAVVGRVVHWLCLDAKLRRPYHILAVDAEAAEGTGQLPPGYSSRMFATVLYISVRLVQVGGRLSLAVAETLAVSMWTMTSPSAEPAGCDRDAGDGEAGRVAGGTSVTRVEPDSILGVRGEERRHDTDDEAR